jgi:hypothetical protein
MDRSFHFFVQVAIMQSIIKEIRIEEKIFQILKGPAIQTI